MPQVAFHLLPVFQEGEELIDDENENKVNDGVTVNFVNGVKSWMLVQRCKKKKVKKDNKNERWNKQQQEYFQRYGNIYRQEPYKSYRNVDIAPSVANMPLQQRVQLPAVQPNILPAPPAVAAPLPIPLIIISLLPQPMTPDSCKRLQLKGIPEEDKLPEPQQKKN